jgi:hypothetical protein
MGSLEQRREQEQAQKMRRKQNANIMTWFSIAVTVVAAVILVVNVIIGPWRFMEQVKWIMLTILVIGVISCAVFGLKELFLRINRDDEEVDTDKKTDKKKEKPSSSIIEEAKSVRTYVNADNEKAGDRGQPDKEGSNGSPPKENNAKNTEPGSTEAREKKYDPLSCKDESIRVFRSMSNNVKTISEYYTISKQQANSAFVLSFVFCIAGLVMLLLPLLLGVMGLYNNAVAVIGIIAGVVSELFGGTALLVQKSSVNQFNLFFESLHDNEMLLSAVSLAEQMSETKREESFVKIIDSVLKCMTDTFVGTNAEGTDDKTTEETGQTTNPNPEETAAATVTTTVTLPKDQPAAADTGKPVPANKGVKKTENAHGNKTGT